jgi:hypothetical protein
MTGNSRYVVAHQLLRYFVTQKSANEKEPAHSMTDSFNPSSSKDEEVLGKLVEGLSMVAACVLTLRSRNFDLLKPENFEMAFRLVKALHDKAPYKKLIEYVGNLNHLLNMPEADLPATFSLTYRSRRSSRNCTALDAAQDTKKVSYKVFMSIFPFIFVSTLTDFFCRIWKESQTRLSVAIFMVQQRR